MLLHALIITARARFCRSGRQNALPALCRLRRRLQWRHGRKHRASRRRGRPQRRGERRWHSPGGRQPQHSRTTRNLYIGNLGRLEQSRQLVAPPRGHRSRFGHLLKTRAAVNVIEYNRFDDLGGRSSRTIDVPNGGQTVSLSNLIQKGQTHSIQMSSAFAERGQTPTTR